MLYLYTVNKQAVYITQAHIFLAGLAATFWIASKISSADQTGNSKQENVQEKTIDTMSPAASNGRNLFMSKCASCHNVFRDMTGPALQGFEERGPWSDRNKLYSWVRNPEAFMKNDPYTKALKSKYGTMMSAFPNITDEEIDAIVAFLSPGPL